MGRTKQAQRYEAVYTFLRITNRALTKFKVGGLGYPGMIRVGITSSLLISKLWRTMVLDCSDWLAELFCFFPKDKIKAND